VSIVMAYSWHHSDLTEQTGASQATGDIVGYPVVGTDSRVYYVGANDDHVHELAYYQGSWHQRDLTADTGAPALGRPRLAGFAMGGMDPRLYHDDFNNHVHELAYYQSGWHHRDLTVATGAPAKAVWCIAAFQATSTDPRVYYGTYNDNHVHELSHWQGDWHYRDLTADTSAAVADCCELVAFTAGAADSRVYYQRSGHVHELSYWQGGWHHRDITRDIGAPLSEPNLLAGFTVGGPDSRVYHTDTAMHVRELSYWQGGWHYRDLSKDVDASHPEASGLSGFPMGSGGDSRVYSKNGYYGHIYEYAYYQGSWHYHDVSEAADAPRWGGSGEVAAFLAAGTETRVYYTDNGHIRELAYYDDSPGPQKRTVSLQRQMIWEGIPPYLGRFPSFGVVPPGRLLQIHIPQVGLVDLSVHFVKPGHTPAECNNPNAVVSLNEGQSTTPAQINAIFGQREPNFSVVQPLTFVACVGTAGVFPDWLNIEITVEFD
jgi:hypothetical protein